MLYKNYCLSHIYSSNRKIYRGFFRAFFILFIFLSFTVPCLLRADTSLLVILEQSNYTNEQIENIRQIFDDAGAKGIPPNFILPRLEEGIAKKVPFKRLINVLVKEIECLVQARELLASVDPDLVLLEESSIWLRTGILVSKGIPTTVIRAIAYASLSRWGDYRDATVLYLSLTQWGLTDDEALIVVESVLQSAINGQDFIGLMNVFTRGRSLHISPEEIIIRIKEVIDEIDTIEALEEKILY
jgi:hypothetical protein